MKATSKEITIIQRTRRGDEQMRRSVYVNEYGREFVIVNRCFVPVDSCKTDADIAIIEM